MFYSLADNQHVNNELLRRGSTTFGSYEQKVSRLLVFLAIESSTMTPSQRVKRTLFQKRKAKWTPLGLRYSKTESLQPSIPLSIDAPSLSYLQNRGHWS